MEKDEVVNGDILPSKPYITKIAVMTVSRKEGLQNIVLPILRIGIHRKVISHQLIIHTEELKDKFIKQLKKVFPKKETHSLMYSVTNDPRIKYAGSSVSLGYFCFRAYIRNARVINYAPLVFETNNKNDVIFEPHLPQL